MRDIRVVVETFDPTKNGFLEVDEGGLILNMPDYGIKSMSALAFFGNTVEEAIVNDYYYGEIDIDYSSLDNTRRDLYISWLNYIIHMKVGAVRPLTGYLMASYYINAIYEVNLDESTRNIMAILEEADNNTIEKIISEGKQIYCSE